METLGIPILGSPSDKHVLISNKALTRAVVRLSGINIAPGVELFQLPFDDEVLKNLEDEIGYPMVVKAATLEDSRGVFIARNMEEVKEYIRKAFELSPEGVVVEKFIPGREIRSCVIQNENGEPVFLPSVIEYHVG